MVGLCGGLVGVTGGAGVKLDGTKNSISMGVGMGSIDGNGCLSFMVGVGRGLVGVTGGVGGMVAVGYGVMVTPALPTK